MFINPKTAIENGWITGKFSEDSIQPNAIDFTLDYLYSINHDAAFVLSEDGKQMRGGDKVPTIQPGDGCVESLHGYWRLESNEVYDGMSAFHVKVPENVAVQLIIRSTLNRNGLFITSGLYDAGFEGNVGFAIHNRSGAAFIKPGTRIGQIMFLSADSEGMYSGGYNTEKGKHWTE